MFGIVCGMLYHDTGISHTIQFQYGSTFTYPTEKEKKKKKTEKNKWMNEKLRKAKKQMGKETPHAIINTVALEQLQ